MAMVPSDFPRLPKVLGESRGFAGSRQESRPLPTSRRPFRVKGDVTLNQLCSGPHRSHSHSSLSSAPAPHPQPGHLPPLCPLSCIPVGPGGATMLGWPSCWRGGPGLALAHSRCSERASCVPVRVGPWRLGLGRGPVADPCADPWGTRLLAACLLCAELGETPENHAGHPLGGSQACGQEQRGSQEPG